ncbi:hypothetical protein CI238_01174, partial [Colletotrichum incanum]
LRARTSTSSSLRALASSPPSPLVALVVLLPLLAVPPPLVVTPPLRRLPRRRTRRSLTTTWDSVSSTKRLSHAPDDKPRALVSSKKSCSNRPTFSHVVDMRKSLLGWASVHVCVGTPARFGQIESSLVL